MATRKMTQPGVKAIKRAAAAIERAAAMANVRCAITWTKNPTGAKARALKWRAQAPWRLHIRIRNPRTGENIALHVDATVSFIEMMFWWAQTVLTNFFTSRPLGGALNFTSALPPRTKTGDAS